MPPRMKVTRSVCHGRPHRKVLDIGAKDTKEGLGPTDFVDPSKTTPRTRLANLGRLFRTTVHCGVKCPLTVIVCVNYRPIDHRSANRTFRSSSSFQTVTMVRVVRCRPDCRTNVIKVIPARQSSVTKVV